MLPFETDASYHDFHHFKNVGNYGGKMTIWDSLFDMNTDYYQAYPEGTRYNEHLKEQ